jgi:hypothetical protein
MRIKMEEPLMAYRYKMIDVHLTTWLQANGRFILLLVAVGTHMWAPLLLL